MPDAQADTLTRRFQERIAVIGQQGAAVTTAAFAGMGRYEQDDIDSFAQRVAAALAAAKAAAVATGVGYYSLLLQVRPPTVRAGDVLVPDETPEPFIAYWRALNAGRSAEDALTAGVSRAEAIARNLAVSAGRRTGDVVIERTGRRVTGWRRALDGGACEWCRSLTAYTFKTAEAADFGHDRCGCTPRPVIG